MLKLTVQIPTRLKLLVIVVFTIGITMTSQHPVEAYESPNYKVLEEKGAVEIRQYEEVVVARVTVTGNRKESSNKAFRLLFNYISGGNKSKNSIEMTSPVTQQSQSQKISMTAPVSQQQNSDGTWNIAFFMPKEFTMKTLPDPEDKRVSIIELNKNRMATIRFSGRYSDANFHKNNKELLAYLNENNLEYEHGPIYAYYNSPFTPWFMRRTEIMYQLKP